MEERLPLLRKLPLFRGMTDEEILRALECFHARELRFNCARLLLEPGELPYWGVVLEGSITVLQEDLRGNRTTLGKVCGGDYADGKTLAKAGSLSMPFYIDVQAGTLALLFDRETVMNPVGEGSRVHALFLRNALEAASQFALELMQKIDYLSRRTTREKLLSFLTIQAAGQGARRFNVPYTRQELADLLAVDRSAMCTELTRMQNDGLIRFDRKRFEILGK